MQLSQAEITQLDKQQYTISGAVDFSTVPGLMQRAVDFLKSYKKSAASQSDMNQVKIDLAPVTDCNSAGLALLLEIFKQAHLNNINVHFENLPETLLTIAKAYGVESEIRKICK
jgi:phospholipid transport system transporter-binding protein